MMAEDKTKTKFSTTVVAITGLISAVGGVITILFNTGVLGGEKKELPKKIEEPPVIVIKKEPEVIKDSQMKEVKTIYVEKPKKKVYSLTGYWIDKNNTNGKYYFHQQGLKNISFTEYSLLFGEWVASATGSGEIEDNNIKLSYTTSFGTNGEFIGSIEDNGNSIGGTVRDLATGLTGSLHLKKE